MAHLYTAVAKKAPVVPKVSVPVVVKPYYNKPSAKASHPLNHGGKKTNPNHGTIVSGHVPQTRPNGVPLGQSHAHYVHTSSHVQEHTMSAHAFAAPYQPGLGYHQIGQFSHHSSQAMSSSPVLLEQHGLINTGNVYTKGAKLEIQNKQVTQMGGVPQVAGSHAASTSNLHSSSSIHNSSSVQTSNIPIYSPSPLTAAPPSLIHTHAKQHHQAFNFNINLSTAHHHHTNKVVATPVNLSASASRPQQAAVLNTRQGPIPTQHTAGGVVVSTVGAAHHEVVPSLPTTLESGMIVEFRAKDGSYRLGLVKSSVEEEEHQQPSLKKWVVTSKTEHILEVEHILEANRVSFMWPVQRHYHFSVADLSALTEQVHADMERLRSNVPVLYGYWVDTKRATTIHVESAASYFFNGAARSHEIYVAHRLLQESFSCFKPTSEPNVYQVLTLAEMSSQRRYLTQNKSTLERKLFIHRLARKMVAADSSLDLAALTANVPDLSEAELRLNVAWNPVQDAAFIAELKKYAFVDFEHAPSELVRTSILEPLGVSPNPEAVYNMLVRIGALQQYENPYVARYPYKLEFTPTELRTYSNQSNVLAHTDRDSQYRRDYRHLGPVFAIDSRLESDEIDDAIGIHRHVDGTTWIYIHIADPSRCVNPNDNLDTLARQRVQSLFIPEKAITMFPPSFSRQHFSLLPGKVNYALTFAVQLNRSTGKIERYEITPSLIDKVTALTYEQADKLIMDYACSPAGQQLSSQQQTTEGLPSNQLSALTTLLEYSEVRRKYRERGGAVFMDMPRPEVEVKDQGESITVTPVRDAESSTRGMVSEFMILVGEITAMFAKTHSIPIPFRSQAKRAGEKINCSAMAPLFETPTSPLKLGRPNKSPSPITAAPTQELTVPRLCPAVTDVEGKEHAGLGLPAYCQATSPIRRYTDLLVHHQIKSFLRGESLPFTASKLGTLISTLESVQSQLNSLSSNSSRYWILRYLERQDPARQYEALVTGDSVNGNTFGSIQSVVWLLELGWKTPVTVSSSKALLRGEKIQVQLQRIDAFNDEVELQEVIPERVPSPERTSPSLFYSSAAAL